ncbi:hypothetical protein LUZ61_012886 [Rhynchospora tenuis]|uniref:Uncharacterized protein n=1 Tax=Rhynchospora tenuis TaxID=198213 RepID=A0AAD6F1P2_9POAL|nr:hypothetical protein LUZ61_012886 [Rhynchospora tenuis]
MATKFSNGTKERAKGASSKDHSITSSTETAQGKEVSQEALNAYTRITNLPGKANQCRPITIFRLPMYIRSKNKALHEPKLVSIGPYYHNTEPLRTLEEHKCWGLRDFIETHCVNLPNCIQKIEALEAVARQCYSETLSLGRDEFVQMLILDGCFILEFIRKHYGNVPDSFFDIERNKATILNDILLVENQIPFFILHELFNIATNSASCSEISCKFRDLIFGLLPPQILWRQPQISCKKIHHLLHFYYLCMVPHPGSMRPANRSFSYKTSSGDKVTLSGIEQSNLTKGKNYNTERDKPLGIPSVNELHEAGVKFKRKRKPRHLLDITFENGVMEIPALYIDDLNCVLLANILAFEQTAYGPGEIISHFVSFYDNLIDTKFDVSWLERRKILINMIGSEAEAASFFNLLGKWNLVEYSEEYQSLITKVQTYAYSLWPRYRANLMRDYFINPWTTISVVAGIVLLGLTALQTYYTVYSSLNS